MLYGVMIGDNAVIVTDSKHGKPIVSMEEIDVPSGYHSEQRWVDNGDALISYYDIVPNEGTTEQAAVLLAQMQFQTLPDNLAYELRALAPAYQAGTTYEAGVRFKDKGNLYRADETFTAPYGVKPQDDTVPCTIINPTVPPTSTDSSQQTDTSQSV